eukprot:scaffold2553_cov138-Cylindrotheca_fusiformis.AAC.17
MADEGDKHSRDEMLASPGQSRSHQLAPTSGESDGFGGRAKAGERNSSRGYHTNDYYGPPRRRGDPSYDDYSRKDEAYERNRSRGRDDFRRNQNHSHGPFEGRWRDGRSDSYQGHPPRDSIEGGFPNHEALNRGRRFDDRDRRHPRFDDRDHRRGFDDRFNERNHHSSFDDRDHHPRYDDDDDWDDRARSDRRSPGKFRTSKKELEEREWPPCFDIDGSAFVFDNRSAMFYESQSDFFYDPKSKLYYGNKKGAYFRYDKSEKPPFVEVQKMAGKSADGGIAHDASEVTVEPIQNTLAKPKPAIAINLKIAKKSKQPKGLLQKKVAPTVSKVEKERIANIEKWNEKQAELKPESAQKIRTTSKGEPICTLCKRKFPSIEKLRLHEKASELHKSNLAKAAKAKEVEDSKRKEAPSGNYEDRAQKRRNLHGADTAIVQPASLQQDEPSAFEPTQSESLGSSNIGNKMLQKMGWQQFDKPEDGQQQHIRKDWDRIESLANRQRPPR